MMSKETTIQMRLSIELKEKIKAYVEKKGENMPKTCPSCGRRRRKPYSISEFMREAINLKLNGEQE